MKKLSVQYMTGKTIGWHSDDVVLVVTVKTRLKSVYIFTEIIAKLKQGYHFFGTLGMVGVVGVLVANSGSLRRGQSAKF